MDLQQQLQETLGEGYRIDRELGRGGMSRVFLAHERTLGRDVVVKVLPPEMAAGVSVERFEREIQLAAKLQHPHIVPVLAAGQSAGLPYFTMPFIAGESLRQRLQRERELPVPEAMRLLRDVGVALHYAHGRGVVHRDIKPENILLTGGIAVVADFGVSKALAAASTTEEIPVETTLTSVGMALGTPAYMAPEQAAADPATDHRADIYAWGVLAYEMLTGSTPFGGRSPHAMIAAHMAEPVKSVHLYRPGVPAPLADLVMRSLEKRPADRPQSAAELVQVVDSVLATGVTSLTPQPAAVPRRKRRLLAYGGIAALLVLLLSFAATALRRSADPAGGEVTSIAVLPFVDATGGEDYWAEGMSDELSAALGKVPGLQVASRTSTFAFKGPQVDVREVGRKLSVDAVLEGRVRRAGDRVRVTAQLTSARTGLSLWSDSYEREQSDVFAVQDDLARAIAGALRLRLQPAAAVGAVVEARGTNDVVAYDLYVRGRYHWHRRGAENLQLAVDYFRRAIERDPGFARAYAGLAIASVLLPEYTDEAGREVEAAGEQAARRALAMDSTLAEAHAAIGLARVHAWDWAAAESAYQRALHFEPRYATAHQWYGELLYHVGRVEESVAAMNRAAELEPLAPIAAVAQAYALLCARRFREAMMAGERAVELAPDLAIAHRLLSVTLLFAGERERAYLHASRARDLAPELARASGEMAYVAGLTGRRDEAQAIVAELEQRVREGGTSVFGLVFGYLGVGQLDAAGEMFERAVDRHEILVTSYAIAMDPILDPLRSHPRFRSSLERMGLGHLNRGA